MRYFDEKMNTIESRTRYFDLMCFHPVSKEEQAEVQREYEQMIKINIAQERALAEAGIMC